MSRCKVVLAVFIVVLNAPLLLAGDADNPVPRARRLLGNDDTPRKSKPEELASSAAALDAYVEGHPDDIEALILSARMTFWANAFSASESKQKPEVIYAAMQKRLDRALALQPDNAEANYWKGWMLLVGNSRQSDAGEAIRLFRRAVELAPREDRYKESLGELLLDQGKAKEALSVLALLRNGQHPTYLLLSDLESFPMPETAVLDRMKSSEITVNLAESGRVTEPLYPRVRFYFVPATAAELERFLKERIPSFALGEASKVQQDEKGRVAMYGLLFRRAAAGWEPVRPLPDDAKGGMVAIVMEYRGLSAETRKALPPAMGETFCTVILENFRRVHR